MAKRQRRPQAPRWKSLAILGMMLVLAACTSTPKQSAGPTPERADPLAGITVPDAFTPLTVTPISRPTFPFPGTDDKYHLAFDMQVTNSTAAAATLTGVDVVDARDPKKVLASFAGNQLVDPACNYGNCNRLRLVPAAPAKCRKKNY